MSERKYIVGIDEAGRGPLAGPVAVGICIMETGFNAELLDTITDSKKLSERSREKWFEKLDNFTECGKFMWNVRYSTPECIDTHGIVSALQKAINRGLRRASYLNNTNTTILLDGGLRAPRRFENQQTIIRGDEKKPVISAASIVAKVVRDRKMVRFDTQFPEYGFAQHKGYPTPGHYEAIKEHGISRVHRESFLAGMRA